VGPRLAITGPLGCAGVAGVSAGLGTSAIEFATAGAG
jgi:hypothetical protein